MDKTQQRLNDAINLIFDTRGIALQGKDKAAAAIRYSTDIAGGVSAIYLAMLVMLMLGAEDAAPEARKRVRDTLQECTAFFLKVIESSAETEGTPLRSEAFRKSLSKTMDGFLHLVRE